MYSCLAGVVAIRAQWRFGIFAVRLQMAIKFNQAKKKKKKHYHTKLYFSVYIKPIIIIVYDLSGYSGIHYLV